MKGGIFKYGLILIFAFSCQKDSNKLPVSDCQISSFKRIDNNTEKSFDVVYEQDQIMEVQSLDLQGKFEKRRFYFQGGSLSKIVYQLDNLPVYEDVFEYLSGKISRISRVYDNNLSGGKQIVSEYFDLSYSAEDLIQLNYYIKNGEAFSLESIISLEWTNGNISTIDLFDGSNTFVKRFYLSYDQSTNPLKGMYFRGLKLYSFFEHEVFIMALNQNNLKEVLVKNSASEITERIVYTNKLDQSKILNTKVSSLNSTVAPFNIEYYYNCN